MKVRLRNKHFAFNSCKYVVRPKYNEIWEMEVEDLGNVYRALHSIHGELYIPKKQRSRLFVF